MNTISYYTEEGLQKIKQELQKLKTIDRKKVVQDISEAREKGDLSENAEYDAAKEAQSILEKKIKKLEILVGNARILTKADIDTSKVSMLSKVTILNKKLNKQYVYNIVSPMEADIKADKISSESPIAKGLMGKNIGETTTVETPSGPLVFEIVNIEI
jgi:transcription elongation factor GreA